MLEQVDISVRGNYNLKEATLVTTLVTACGFSKKSSTATKAVKWRSGGGKNAGNFPLVMEQVHCMRLAAKS